MLKLDNGPSSVDTTSTGCNQKSSAQPEFLDGPKVHNNKSQTAGEVLLSTFSYFPTTYLRIAIPSSSLSCSSSSS